MTKHFKRPLSILLAAMMVLSLFVAVPMTASATTTAYVKVTSAPSDGDWSGEYLVVYEVDNEPNKVFNSAANLASGANTLQAAFGVSDGNIDYDNTTAAAAVTIAKIGDTGYYSIKTASGKYIGRSNDTNGIDERDSALDNTIAWDNGSVKITSAGGAIMRYNTGSSQFRYYKSATYTNQKPIQLYKLGAAAASTYTVTWKNGDSVIETDTGVAAGTTPTYDGEEPTKAEDNDNTYTFSGWTDGENTYGLTDALPAVTADVTYTAVFTAEPKTYTVTWKNWDGSVLETDENVAAGATPSYDGEDPVRPEDDEKVFEFAGWDPEISAVDGNVEYTAQFTEGVKEIINGKYYVNGELVKGAGLIKLGDDYYFVKANGTIYKDASLCISEDKTNGLLPAGKYAFDEDGKMIIYNGIVNGCYYVDGAAVKGAGLIEIDGDYYYVKANGTIYKDSTLVITEEKANGLAPAGLYTFDADGKMVYKDGVVDGYYYVNNVLTKGVGLVEHDGDIYFVKQNGAIYKNSTLVVTEAKTNGLAPKGIHAFDADGKMVN